MNNSIVQAECVSLTKLEHLFIDLEYFKNQDKNTGVYRSRSFNQKNKKHLQLEEIKDALSCIDKTSLKYIYFIGRNSMSHPEFNHILRFCLNISSVTIFTDGACINDKKARFLKRVDDEGTHEIIFKVFINHYDEKINDSFSSRGAFRNVIHAVNSLNKYGFNPIFAVKTKGNDLSELKNGFIELGKKFKFETDDINFSFIPDEKNFDESAFSNVTGCLSTQSNFDCMHSRVLSKSGVYNCPMLLNDYRGHSGANLRSFGHKCFLETEKCQMCKSFAGTLYINDWD